MIFNRVNVGVYKDNPDALLPEYMTDGACAADIFTCFVPEVGVMACDPDNVKQIIKPYYFENNHREPGSWQFDLQSGWRALVPTGLIFDIPHGYSLRFHSRSGHGWKYGTQLANSEGLIDQDYVDPSFVLLYNFSDVNLTVKQFDSVGQVEIVPVLRMKFVDVRKPEKKTNRDGGFGSTSKK